MKTTNNQPQKPNVQPSNPAPVKEKKAVYKTVHHPAEYREVPTDEFGYYLSSDGKMKTKDELEMDRYSDSMLAKGISISYGWVNPQPTKRVLVKEAWDEQVFSHYE